TSPHIYTGSSGTESANRNDHGSQPVHCCWRGVGPLCRSFRNRTAIRFTCLAPYLVGSIRKRPAASHSALEKRRAVGGSRTDDAVQGAIVRAESRFTSDHI